MVEPSLSETLSFSVGDDTWKKMRAKAETDLWFFATAVLGYSDKFALRERTHRAFVSFLERKTGSKDIDEAPYQLIMLPRDVGKTSIGTISYAIWLACKDPDTAILIANERQENASDFLASIKKQFETNDLLRALFPEIIPADFSSTTWSATRATLKRKSQRPEPTFDTIGVGGTVTGRHYNAVLVDDLISREAMEAARAGNQDVMKKANRWVNQLVPLLSSGAKPFPQIRFIGTRWWAGDTYDHIEEAFGYGEEKRSYRLRFRLTDGTVVTRDVYRCGDLSVLRMAGIEDGKPAFPEIWPDERMAKMRMQDPELFSCNIMNDPSSSDVRIFRDEWLRYWTYSDPQTITYVDAHGKRHFTATNKLYKLIAVDPAFSSSKDSDRAAIVTLGLDYTTGKYFVLDVSAKRSDPQDTLTDILNTAQNWGVNRVFVEIAGQQVAFKDWLERTAAERNVPINVEPLKPSGRNKALRIEALVVPFKDNQIYVHASQSALIDDEYRKWRPGYKLQDVLDALAYALEVVPKPATGRNNMTAAERSRQQLAAYHTRLGVH